QGIQKSTPLRPLAGGEWFSDRIGELSAEDALLSFHGVWIIEFSELAALRRSQLEAVKAFLTAPSDYFRPPYGHRNQHVQRSNIFAGSVNDHHYLADETGGRRFWPVSCGVINIPALAR